jgi:hypothetical protein
VDGLTEKEYKDYMIIPRENRIAIYSPSLKTLLHTL